MEPAPIRTKNPGAMWGRVGKKPTAFFETPQGPHGCETNAPIPVKWGSKKTIYLSDGLGQNNNIAIFDTWIDGICAQLDLWRTSAHYRNKRFADAIATWSGGNNVPSYIAYVKARVPGITEDTIMNDAFWKGPMGLAFLKAQAGHESGVPRYPAPDADWGEAQKRVFRAANAGKTAGTVVVIGTTTAAAAHFMSAPTIAAVVFSAAAVAALVIWLKHRK